MKLLYAAAACWCSILGSVAQAQPTPSDFSLASLGTQPTVLYSTAPKPAGDALNGLTDVSQERERIGQERAHNALVLDAREQSCYAKFAVNACLEAVRIQRHTVQGDLARQERVLNDAQRKQRAATQLQNLEDKAQEKAQRQTREAQDKTLGQQPAAPTGHAVAGAQAKPATGAQRVEKSTPLLDLATQAENRAAYARKQEEALKRHADLVKRLESSKNDGAVTSLPTPALAH